MSYMYQSFQQVPTKTIKAIGIDIKNNFFMRVRHLPDKLLQEMAHEFDMAVNQIGDENGITVDGYRLNADQVSAIGQLLKLGKPIAAIKEFRYATGVGLREAKDFIDKFSKFKDPDEAFILFTNAFAG
jgi:ribosomal protein L7/L12